MRALIAGQGRLPRIVWEATGGEAVVCELNGFPSGLPDPLVFRIETLGSLLDALAARGVQDVCFAGAIRRPSFDPAHVDAATRPLVPTLAAALQAGDDGALRAVLGLFEARGFVVRAAHEFVPGLVPSAGILSRAKPGAADRRDAARAADIHAALSAADLGQALAVARGQALAVEALGGTDWMLASLAGGRRPDTGSGGILFKAPKAGQDRRIDLPAIGPETVDGAARAGLGGIVIEAGGVMVLDRESVLDRCAVHGLFLWAREP